MTFCYIIVYNSHLFCEALVSGAPLCIALGKMQGFHRKINRVCYDNVSHVLCPEWHLFIDWKKGEVNFFLQLL